MASNLGMKMFEGHIIEIEGENCTIKKLLGFGSFGAVYKFEKENNK
jgi:hypothetical protein